MPRFLSAEWVAEFNRALEGAVVAAADTAGSLAATNGQFRVAQVVNDVPSDAHQEAAGQIRTELVVTDGAVHLEVLGPSGGSADAPQSPREDPEVTILLSYSDAVALSKGELDPAAALGAGRVRVRGDLSVLVAGQAVLAAASARLADLQAHTTY